MARSATLFVFRPVRDRTKPGRICSRKLKPSCPGRSCLLVHHFPNPDGAVAPHGRDRDCSPWLKRLSYTTSKSGHFRCALLRLDEL